MGKILEEEWLQKGYIGISVYLIFPSLQYASDGMH